MPKTYFADGTPVTPAWLNAVTNPTFSEDPQNDGEIEFPPNIGNPFRNVPRSRFYNSNLCFSDNSGLSTIDLTSGVGALATLKTYCSGLKVSTNTTSGAVWALAAGDPQKGAWAWPVSATQFNVGEILEFYIGGDDVDLGSVYGLENFGVAQEPFYLSTQLTVEHGGGSGAFQAELEDGLFADLISSGIGEVVFKSTPQVLENGDSAVFHYILKITPNGDYLGSPLCAPRLIFTCTSAGVPEIRMKNLGVFTENIKGRVIPILQGFTGGLQELRGDPNQLLSQEKSLQYRESGTLDVFAPAIQAQTGPSSERYRTTKIFVPFKKEKVSLSGNVTITNASIDWLNMDGSGLDFDSSPDVTVLSVGYDGFLVQLSRAAETVAPYDGFDEAYCAQIRFDWVYLFQQN